MCLVRVLLLIPDVVSTPPCVYVLLPMQNARPHVSACCCPLQLL